MKLFEKKSGDFYTRQIEFSGFTEVTVKALAEKLEIKVVVG